MGLNPNWARAGMGVLLVVLWTALVIWLRAGRSPAIPTGFLLSLYLIYPLYALIKPAGQTDPAMRAAQGGLFAIVLLLSLMLVVLLVGTHWRRPGLVWTAFVVAMVPIAVMSCSWVVYVLGLFWKK